MERLAAQGINLFDDRYTPVPNTNPQKHDASWVQAYRNLYIISPSQDTH